MQPVFKIEDFQKLSQTNLDSAMKAFGEWNKGVQNITAEMTDYTKRSFEEGTPTFEKRRKVLFTRHDANIASRRNGPT